MWPTGTRWPSLWKLCSDVPGRPMSGRRGDPIHHNTPPPLVCQHVLKSRHLRCYWRSLQSRGLWDTEPLAGGLTGPCPAAAAGARCWVQLTRRNPQARWGKLKEQQQGPFEKICRRTDVMWWHPTWRLSPESNRPWHTHLQVFTSHLTTCETHQHTCSSHGTSVSTGDITAWKRAEHTAATPRPSWRGSDSEFRFKLRLLSQQQVLQPLNCYHEWLWPDVRQVLVDQSWADWCGPAAQLLLLLQTISLFSRTSQFLLPLSPSCSDPPPPRVKSKLNQAIFRVPLRPIPHVLFLCVPFYMRCFLFLYVLLLCVPILRYVSSDLMWTADV